MNCYHVMGAFFMSGKKNPLVEKGVFRSFYGFTINGDKIFTYAETREIT